MCCQVWKAPGKPPGFCTLGSPREKWLEGPRKVQTVLAAVWWSLARSGWPQSFLATSLIDEERHWEGFSGVGALSSSLEVCPTSSLLPTPNHCLSFCIKCSKHVPALRPGRLGALAPACIPSSSSEASQRPHMSPERRKRRPTRFMEARLPPSLLSVVVIKHLPRATWGGKGLFCLTL